MEERRLNERESLELIARMMQNTKQNLEVGEGNRLIVWGVAVLIADIVVLALLYFTQSPMSHWAWMLVPIIGCLWTRLASTSRPRVITKIDKMVAKFFGYITCITVLLPIVFVALCLLTEVELIVPKGRLMAIIPFLEMLIVSLGLTATGVIIDFKPLRIGGLVGVVLSLSLLCNIQYVHTFMFGVWAIVSMIIPGIKLNQYIKHV